MVIGGKMAAGVFIGFGDTRILDLSYRFLVTHSLRYFVPALLFVYRRAWLTITGLMESAMRFDGACIITYDAIVKRKIKRDVLRQTAGALESES